MIRHGVAAVFAAALLAVSCGGDDDTATSVADPTSDSTAQSVEGSVDSTQPEPESTESESPESTVADPPTDPILAVPDAEVIAQTTPTSGGGTRPLLSWEPVDGATTYLVIVFADDEAPYWSTITERTETHVGGQAAIPEGIDGPEVSAGYSWAVYADDENGVPIASSSIRPISP
jgi:hypothetical protein